MMINKNGEQFIQGIKVVGGRDKIIESADLYDIDEILWHFLPLRLR